MGVFFHLMSVHLSYHPHLFLPATLPATTLSRVFSMLSCICLCVLFPRRVGRNVGAGLVRFSFVVRPSLATDACRSWTPIVVHVVCCCASLRVFLLGSSPTPPVSQSQGSAANQTKIRWTLFDRNRLPTSNPKNQNANYLLAFSSWLSSALSILFYFQRLLYYWNFH